MGDEAVDRRNGSRKRMLLTGAALVWAAALLGYLHIEPRMETSLQLAEASATNSVVCPGCGGQGTVTVVVEREIPYTLDYYWEDRGVLSTDYLGYVTITNDFDKGAKFVVEARFIEGEGGTVLEAETRYVYLSPGRPWNFTLHYQPRSKGEEDNFEVLVQAPTYTEDVEQGCPMCSGKGTVHADLLRVEVSGRVSNTGEPGTVTVGVDVLDSEGNFIGQGETMLHLASGEERDFEFEFQLTVEALGRDCEDFIGPLAPCIVEEEPD